MQKIRLTFLWFPFLWEFGPSSPGCFVSPAQWDYQNSRSLLSFCAPWFKLENALGEKAVANMGIFQCLHLLSGILDPQALAALVALLSLKITVLVFCSAFITVLNYSVIVRSGNAYSFWEHWFGIFVFCLERKSSDFYIKPRPGIWSDLYLDGNIKDS